MQLPNPNNNQPFHRVIKGNDGQELYGIRDENTPQEEIVYIPTGKSNHKYYQPEMIMNPEGCNHNFVISDMGKREVTCTSCNFATSFILGVNMKEHNGSLGITLKDREYPVKPL